MERYCAGLTAERYRNLIKDLDKESVRTVSKILSRMQLMIQKPIPEGREYVDIDIFNPEEKRELDMITMEFDRQIIQLGENGPYAWRKYLMPRKHFERCVFYYRLQLPALQPASLEWIRDKDVMDVGANDGDSALILREYTDGTIYSFEPVNEIYDAMLKTIELNGLKNVVPVHQALGSREETSVIKVAGTNGISSTINRDRIALAEGETQTVSITTLDRFLEDKPEVNVGLIKVDIEGLEQEFLKGAEQTIRRFRPVMLLSIYHTAGDFFDIKPLLESWNLGYRFKIIFPATGGVYVETMLLCEVPDQDRRL